MLRPAILSLHIVTRGGTEYMLATGAIGRSRAGRRTNLDFLGSLDFLDSRGRQPVRTALPFGLPRLLLPDANRASCALAQHS